MYKDIVLYTPFFVGGGHDRRMGGVETIYLRNFLFEGLPCFTAGMLARGYDLKKYFSKSLLIVLIIVLCTGCIVESHLYESTHQSVSTSLLAFPLLLLFLSFKEDSFAKLMKKFKGNDSLYVYIFHPAVMFAIAQINNKFLPEAWTQDIYPYVSPILVFGLTLIFVIATRLIWNGLNTRNMKRD